MCLIAHRKGHGHITDEIVEHNLWFNSDGFGIAWRDGRSYVYEKFGPKDDTAFTRLLFKIDKQEGVEYAAHFRTATHGDKCKELSHPFTYRDSRGKEVLVFHNGIIDIRTAVGESDTSQFVKSVLSRLPDLWWRRDHYLYLVEAAIGWSRMLIMSGRESIRLNEDDWKQQGGLWYSTNPLPTYTSVWSNGRTTDNRTVTTPTKAVDPKDFDGYPVRQTSEVSDHTKDGWFTSDGHQVIVTDRTKPEEDRDYEEADLLCLDCNTVGDLYVIEGQGYADLSHFPGAPEVKKLASGIKVA